jgi:hypothetical protein
MKNFHITERANLQFRAESFNTANHPNFGRPSWIWLLLTSATFSGRDRHG